MRHLDLFSGIGGFALAASWVWGKDYENVGHSEIEEYPCKVYHRHFPTSLCLGDITKIRWREGQADIITGGFPCQDISQAGLKAGIGGERSGLWKEMVRAVGVVRPKIALMENVSALLRRGMDVVAADLSAIGYDAEWDIIPASVVGAHFIGERVWIVAAPSPARGLRWKRVGSDPMGKNQWGGDEFERLVQLEIQNGVPAGKSGRISDGISHRMDRLTGLGNAIVPQVAAQIFQAIKTGGKMRFRKKPVEVEAVQWFKVGDHPAAREFRTAIPGCPCAHCGKRLDVHGWIVIGGHMVCPGDWIITGVKGEHCPCKPDVFEATYESIE